MEKRDHLAICNELGVPSQDFEMQFCARCLQSECVRSQHGKSRFEQRVVSWKGRLFDEVPRMNASDPRLLSIRAKKFVEIDTGRVPEIGGKSDAWVDPRDLDEPRESPQATASEPEPVAQVTPPPEPVTVPPVEPKVSEPKISERAVPQLMNTQVQQGRMIGGRKPEPPRDPWEVKTQETQGLQVVKPGARIKLGSGV